MVWRSWRPNGMLQHGKRVATVAVGAAGAAAANASSAQAECKAALGQERLEEAASLIKDELIKSQDLKSLANSQDGLVLSTDGTPWIFPRSPDESDFDLLELSTHIAADPVVVEKIREKAEAQGLLRSIESWPTTRSSSPAFSVLLDSGLELENENERLRLENERLRCENEKLKLEQGY